MSVVLGQCRWCGHNLRYASPGTPPADCVVAGPDFYAPPRTWRDFSLVDVPLDFGKFCPQAPPHPLGQYAVHQLGFRTFLGAAHVGEVAPARAVHAADQAAPGLG